MKFRVGDTASFSKTITEADLVLFAGVSGDTNPLHLDAEYAKATRFGARIAHGMLTASLISAVLGTRLPGPGGIYLSQTLKFLKPVFVGDTITATVTITAVHPERPVLTLKTLCTNAQGERVVEGEARVLYEPSERGKGGSKA